MKSKGLAIFAAIPPTVAAAEIIASGLFSDAQSKTIFGLSGLSFTVHTQNFNFLSLAEEATMSQLIQCVRLAKFFTFKGAQTALMS